MEPALFFRLACVLLIPLFPAVLLYTKLPSKTAVTGPFKGLNLKLSGAFGGYFLLVLLAISIMIATDKREDLKSEIAQLRAQLDNQATWTIDGQLQTTVPQDTRIFVSGNSLLRNTTFNINNIVAPVRKGKISMALCFYNPGFGYRIFNIDENFPAEIERYQIAIDRMDKTIHIKRPIAFK